jgi:hypothetical protein
MAKPIEGIPPFKGKAAIWLDKYLQKAQPDPQVLKDAAKERKEIEQRVTPR